MWSCSMVQGGEAFVIDHLTTCSFYHLLPEHNLLVAMVEGHCCIPLCAVEMNTKSEGIVIVAVTG